MSSFTAVLMPSRTSGREGGVAMCFECCFQLTMKALDICPLSLQKVVPELHMYRSGGRLILHGQRGMLTSGCVGVGVVSETTKCSICGGYQLDVWC